LLDAGEGFEQFEAVGEGGVVRVEFAHGVEVQSEPALPIADVIVRTGAIDDCEARLSGEPEDFHFGSVNLEQMTGSDNLP
jgi:hypothetical protein